MAERDEDIDMQNDDVLYDLKWRIGNASRMGRILVRRFLLFDRKYRQPFYNSSERKAGGDGTLRP